MSASVRIYRGQSLGEEIANSISHGVGLLASLAITPILILASIPLGAWSVVGASVFGASMIVLYLASTLYHAFPESKAKQVFKILDHSAIYLLIAGTYTPFTLSVLSGAWGWALFGTIWGLAFVGMVLKSIGGGRTSTFHVVLYLAMGWMAVLAVKPLWASMPAWGLFWILAGGLMYSGGVYFFLTDHKLRYGHFIWHLFTLAGTACHVIAVLAFAYRLPV